MFASTEFLYADSCPKKVRSIVDIHINFNESPTELSNGAKSIQGPYVNGNTEGFNPMLPLLIIHRG